MFVYQTALYRLLQSALLFYRKLRSELEDHGFTVNPYDPCVANKMINGKHMTVTWHVDDLKISHMDTKDMAGRNASLPQIRPLAIDNHSLSNNRLMQLIIYCFIRLILL